MHYGVDFGSRRLAVFCPSSGAAAEIRLPRPTKTRPANPHGELRELAGWFAATVPAEAHIWVEAPFVGMLPGGGNKRTAIRLGMTVGAIFAAHAGPALLVDQSTWKAKVVGDGSADKPAVRQWLEEHHPALAAVCGESQDLVDAACIGIHGTAVAHAERVRGS